MTVKLLTEHNVELLSLTGSCTYLSESTLVKLPLTCHGSLLSTYNCVCFLGNGGMAGMPMILPINGGAGPSNGGAGMGMNGVDCVVDAGMPK